MAALKRGREATSASRATSLGSLCVSRAVDLNIEWQSITGKGDWDALQFKPCGQSTYSTALVMTEHMPGVPGMFLHV